MSSRKDVVKPQPNDRPKRSRVSTGVKTPFAKRNDRGKDTSVTDKALYDLWEAVYEENKRKRA